MQEVFSRLYTQGSTVVSLTRRDKIAQGVSFVHASQTGRWTPIHNLKSGSAVYDRQLIDRAITGILRLEQRRQIFLATAHKGPRLDIEYEDVSASPETAVWRVAQLLGLRMPEGFEHGPRPIESELKTMWVERYRAGK
jgi:LPS sulfotransferase NodH